MTSLFDWHSDLALWDQDLDHRSIFALHSTLQIHEVAQGRHPPRRTQRGCGGAL